MTIPRVLLALALLVIGGMLWGLHKDIYSIKEGLTSQGATVAQRIDAVNDNINQTVERLMAAIARPPQVITKTEVKTRYKYRKAGRPRAHKPRRYKLFTTPRNLLPNVQLDGLYMVTPEIPETYSTPPPP